MIDLGFVNDRRSLPQRQRGMLDALTRKLLAAGRVDPLSLAHETWWRSIQRTLRRSTQAEYKAARLCLFAVLIWIPAFASAQGQSSATPAPQTNESVVSASSASTPPSSTLPAGGGDKTVAELTTHQETDTTFKVNVNLVAVRVVVRDGQGHAVGTLKKEDFQLFDNGKPQTIARFAAEQTGNRLEPTTTAGAGQEPLKPEAPERYVAYLFDDLHLLPEEVSLVRSAALTHLNSLLPEDRAAVYTTSGSVMLDFTDDRAKLRDALVRINSSPIASAPAISCLYITPYQADLIVNKHDAMALQYAIADYINCLNMPIDAVMAKNVVRVSSDRVVGSSSLQGRMALDTLRDVVSKIAVMPGLRTIVLVSPGFLLIDNTQREGDLIDRALRSNVVISTLDARGLYTGEDITQRNQSSQTVTILRQYALQSASDESNVLSELPYGTGGIFVHNTNDLVDGFQRIAAMPKYYYVLGFAPQNLKNDGKYHTLKVTLANKQPYTLQARKGYFSPTKLQNAAEQAKSDINDAVFSQEERRDMPVELHTKYFKTSDEHANLSVLVKVDVRHLHYQKVDGRNRNDLTVVSALFDRNGNFVQGDQKTLEMRLTDETLGKKLDSGVTLRANFDVKPGSYLVRCVVRDAEGQLSAANDAVEIP